MRRVASAAERQSLRALVLDAEECCGMRGRCARWFVAWRASRGERALTFRTQLILSTHAVD